MWSRPRSCGPTRGLTTAQGGEPLADEAVRGGVGVQVVGQREPLRVGRAVEASPST